MAAQGPHHQKALYGPLKREVTKTVEQGHLSQVRGIDPRLRIITQPTRSKVNPDVHRSG